MATLTATENLTGAYTLDPNHSSIGFVARHAMITKVRGSFGDFAGTGYLDAADPSKSRLEVTVQAVSLDTRNADRDAHLRTNEFFDMENHPEIRFVSTSVEPVADDTYRVTGDLTIRGVTKTVAVDFEYTGSAVDPFGNARIGLEGKVTVNRRDWGLNWNVPLDAGGVMVSEKIGLEFEVSAIKDAA